VTPEAFARIFCADLDLPLRGAFADTVAAQIRAQLEDADAVARVPLAGDTRWADARQPAPGDDLAALGTGEPEEPADELPECRVIVEVRPPRARPRLRADARRSTCRSGRTTCRTTSSGTCSRR
jgi:chromatin structure-remodeling complex subunit SFH1